MFAKCISKLFQLEPAATAVERGVIAAILLTALACLLLALSDPLALAYDGVFETVTTAAR